MRKHLPLKTEYFDWLTNYNIGKGIEKYTGLCQILYQKEFRWYVHNDDNRCEDGLSLRQAFIDFRRLDESHLEVQYFLKTKCSVLEVLVALAKRINDYTYDLNPRHDNTNKWFFEMLDNLKLTIFKGDHISRIDDVAIDYILETLMDRTYDYNGNGSLFPLKKRARQDMSEVEIWYQLMAYLAENSG